MIATARFWLALLAVSLLAYGGGRWQQSHDDGAKYDAERTKAALMAVVDQVKAVDRARAEEQRRTAAQTEIANAATKDLTQARSDADAATSAAHGLRQRVDQLLAARASRHPAASAGGQGQPGADPLDVLVDVLGRSDKASGVLAAYADQLKIAGLACERSYDSLAKQ